ncbi:hypothetical protein F511_00946 [Dorcoceras hygrometricum]|uniref:Uncharacterized protein n=1 Tax=Dorcoceras hygrometricum TaxID=472368 RepID=A0A2Z7ALM4_9LAMI|nr:hypothetical protein F511_00946 [Dorcoceras hygrometricum]
MRVTPWNQYQLVDQETVPDFQLASAKDRIARGCASFGCFGSAATGLENQSPLQVGPNQTQEVLSRPAVLVECKIERNLDDRIDENHSTRKIFSLKSSLKKSTDSSLSLVASAGVDCSNRNEHEVLPEMNAAAASQTGRKVQWMDATGGELVEVREFEMSEDGLDNEFNDGNEKTCSLKPKRSTSCMRSNVYDVRISSARGVVLVCGGVKCFQITSKSLVHGGIFTSVEKEEQRAIPIVWAPERATEGPPRWRR